MNFNFNQFADEFAAFLRHKHLDGHAAANLLNRAYYSPEDRTIYFDDPVFPTSREEKKLLMALRRKNINPEVLIGELKKEKIYEQS